MRAELTEVIDRYEARSKAVDTGRDHRVTVVAYPVDEIS